MVSVTTRKRKRHVMVMRDFAPRPKRPAGPAKSLSRAYHQKKVSWFLVWRFKLLGLAVLGIILVVVYSPIFQIRNIIVTGIKTPEITQSVIEAVRKYTKGFRFFVLPQHNLLLFNSTQAVSTLAENFPTGSIQIYKEWPNVLRLAFAQDIMAAKWQKGGVVYLLNTSGKLAPDSASSEDTYILVDDQSSKDLAIGQGVVDVNTAQFLADLWQEWKQQSVAIKISKVDFDVKALPTLKVVTTSGFYILVTSNQPAKEQVNTLIKFYQEKGESLLTKTEYIDIRFGSRVYYKAK